VSHPHDADERQARRIAAATTGTAHDVEQAGAKSAERETMANSELVDEALKASGKPLAMENRFDRDFSGVRIHTGREAQRAAESLDAAAFTSGQDIFFAPGRFNPGTPEGDRLLAHELTHTIQQAATPPGSHLNLDEDPRVGQSIAAPHPQDDIPKDLLASADLDHMSAQELQKRFTRLNEALKGLTKSTTAEAEQNARLLEDQLAKVTAAIALREKGAFSPEIIKEMQELFKANQKLFHDKKKYESCIVVLNHALHMALGKEQKTTPKSIEASMKLVQAAGRVGGMHVIMPELKNHEPVSLGTSVYDTILSMAGTDKGIYLFTMSIADGYHSVTVIVDRTNPANAKVYWNDQVIEPEGGGPGGSMWLSKKDFDDYALHQAHNAWKFRDKAQKEDAKKPAAERKWKDNIGPDGKILGKYYFSQKITVWRILPP
jgi:hypothetical protein